MASRGEHVAQAAGNREVARYLLRARPNDRYALQWAVTAAFYSAVLCIEAHLADLGLHSVDHFDRDVLLRDHNVAVPADVYRAYNRLKNRSQAARYGVRFFSAGEVRSILDRDLLPVTTFAGLS